MTLKQEIEAFTQFAIGNASQASTLDELYDTWRNQQTQDTDALAVAASLRDINAGETGKPFEDFAKEFRKHNNLGEEP